MVRFESEVPPSPLFLRIFDRHRVGGSGASCVMHFAALLARCVASLRMPPAAHCVTTFMPCPFCHEWMAPRSARHARSRSVWRLHAHRLLALSCPGPHPVACHARMHSHEWMAPRCARCGIQHIIVASRIASKIPYVPVFSRQSVRRTHVVRHTDCSLTFSPVPPLGDLLWMLRPSLTSGQGQAPHYIKRHPCACSLRLRFAPRRRYAHGRRVSDWCSLSPASDSLRPSRLQDR